MGLVPLSRVWSPYTVPTGSGTVRLNIRMARTPYLSDSELSATAGARRGDSSISETPSCLWIFWTLKRMV